MKKTAKTIAGRECFIYDCGSMDTLLIQPIGEHSLETIDAEVLRLEELAGSRPFTLAAFLTDWNQDLPPWETEAVYGREAFGSGAQGTLDFITGSLIPEITAGSKPMIYLGGYSLAGLFALWAAYQTDAFAGVAAASPSVWYPGWMDFAEAREIKAPVVYLSLGKKEEKVRHPLMKTVGDNIRRLYEIVSSGPSDRNCTLEMNPGNHFTDADLRMAKGFAWVLEKKP